MNSYFVVAINYPRTAKRPAEVEAVVNPEITRREVIARIRSGEYDRERIVFIHEINDFGYGNILGTNVKDELIEAAGLPEENIVPLDRQALHWDHRRDLAKETV